MRRIQGAVQIHLCPLCSVTAQTRTSTKRASWDGSHESEAEWPEMVKSSPLSDKPHDNSLNVPAPSEALITCRGKSPSLKKKYMILRDSATTPT